MISEENRLSKLDQACKAPKEPWDTAPSDGSNEAKHGEHGINGIASGDDQKPDRHGKSGEEQSGTSPKHVPERGSATVDADHEFSIGGREEIAVSDHTLRYHFLVNSLGITAFCALGFVFAARDAGLTFVIVYLGCWLGKGVSRLTRICFPRLWPDQDVLQVVPILSDLCSPRLGLMFVALSFRLVFVAEGSPIEDANQWLFAQMFLAFVAAFLCGVNDIVRVGVCRARLWGRAAR